MDDDTVRPVDLIAPPALDERAVLELARAMRAAVDNATEILGGITRRESLLTIADILEPAERAEVDDLLGSTFALRSGGTILGVLHLDDTETIALADLFLGGPGKGEDRGATPIEIHVIARSIGAVLAPIVTTATFSAPGDLDVELDRDLAGLASFLVRSDLTLTVSETEITGGLYLRDPDRAGPAEAASTPVVTSNAATMPIELDIELAAVDMPAVDIGTLAIGDVVIFDVPADAPATARHETKPLFDGYVRHRDDRRFLEVTTVRST